MFSVQRLHNLIISFIFLNNLYKGRHVVTIIFIHNGFLLRFCHKESQVFPTTHCANIILFHRALHVCTKAFEWVDLWFPYRKLDYFLCLRACTFTTMYQLWQQLTIILKMLPLKWNFCKNITDACISVSRRQVYQQIYEELHFLLPAAVTFNFLILISVTVN